jgi:hypothetical protein
MKRDIIVNRLIKEGFSEKTLVKFNDKQLFSLHERIVVNADKLKTDPNLQALAKDPNTEVEVREAFKSKNKKEDKNFKKITKSKKCPDCQEDVKDCKCDHEHLDESKKIKSWVKSLAEENFHSFTSKNEIMELIKVKLNESEVSSEPKVPEFMSYSSIKSSGPAVAPTKPKTSPGTKPGTSPGKPKPRTPYEPGIGPKHKPKAFGLKEEDIMELDHEELKNSPRFEEFRKALAKNINVSVAYVKNDGTVRHMLVKRYLSSYVPSEKERTEKQMAINQTHDVKRVIDLNAYNKSLRETGDKELSAKKSWRTINLDNVMGFMVRGNFIDLRDENEIKDRFGEEVYNSLTKSMVSAMQANQAEAEVPEMA